MKRETTLRGFARYQFKDSGNNVCSIQKSSAALEDRIWLGIDEPELTIFQDKSKGKYITTSMPDNFSVDSRMELTIDQVKELLPILQQFVETGEI